MEETVARAETADSLIPGVKRPVFILGIVSFLTDISSEMIYPLVPLFLTSVLGAPLAAVGLIEGLAESSASVFKAASGWTSDRLQRRKPLVVLGYSLSAVAKPLLAAAYVWPFLLFVRFLDRSGKGLRTAPRDALVADVTPAEVRGRAFGFHRSADTLGAVLGPALALAFLAYTDNFRLIFLLAFIPAALALPLLSLVGERRPQPSKGLASGRMPFTQLGRPFYAFLAVSALFALGNSSDVFLLLRARDVGLSVNQVVLAYILFNAVYALLSMPAGIASDRLGRRRVIAAGYLLFAAVYFGFARANAALIWPLLAVYGLYMALTEGVGRALVADFVPSQRRASALGLYQGALGVGVLLSSLIAGLLWDHIEASAPFLTGGATALAALASFLLLVPRPQASLGMAAVQ